MTADAVDNPTPQPSYEVETKLDPSPSERAAGGTSPSADPPVGPGGSDAPGILDRAAARPVAPAKTDQALWQALAQSSPAEALRLLLAGRSTTEPGWQQRLVRELNRYVATIDGLLSNQVNAILHHPRFQKLEASWRGLKYLVDQAGDAMDQAARDGAEAEVQIRVISLRKEELKRDLDGALEFDQSAMFRKVYDAEFGMPGGTPYGALLGDYEFTNHIEDVELLGKAADVAMASFAPFLTSPAPALLGLDDLTKLQDPGNLSATFQQLEYLKWRALRDRPESQFLGMLLPRVLTRTPYDNDGTHHFGFGYAEDVSGLDFDRYLWGSSIYSFGAVLVRAFTTCGWFADIRGADRGTVSGGMVPGLPVHRFAPVARHVATKMRTQVTVPEDREAELCDLGFISLCQCHDSDHVAFYSNPSVHRPKKYNTVEATTNAKMSAMLQYVLCASRFAHYLKVFARDKIGAGINDTDLQDRLNRWLSDYVTTDELASAEMKARYPLHEARVEVTEILEKPGAFKLQIYLLPHFQLDQLTVALKLQTDFAPLGRT